MYNEIIFHPGRLNGTGTPDDLAWEPRKHQPQSTWSLGYTDTKSRLELLIRERTKSNLAEVAP